MATAPTSWRARWALAALVAGYLLLAVVAAAPDSPLVPPVPVGVKPAGWLVRAAREIGLGRIGRAGLTTLSLCLLAVTVTAFVVVVVEAWRGRVGLAVVVGVGLASVAIVLLPPVLLSRDVYSYAAYGRISALHGGNPYVTAPSAFPGDPFTPVISSAWRNTRSVYGPAFSLLSAWIGGLWRGSPAATVATFKVVAAAAVAGAGLLAVGAARRWGRGSRAVAAGAFVLLNPVMVVHTAGGGHNDALIALAIAGAAFLAAPPRRPGMAYAATAALTLATLVKVVAAVPLLMWLWWLWREAPSPNRGRTAVGHVGLAAGLAVAASAPFFAGWRTVTALANLASRQGWASGARLVARWAQALGRALGGDEAATVMGGAAYAAFLAAFVVVFVVLIRSRRRQPDAWGTALIVFALSAPYLLPWYAAWFLPLLALVADDRLVRIGVAMSAVLALTGVPAEPGTAPGLWHGMLLAVHYGAAPLMLAMFGIAVHRVVVGSAAGAEPAGPPVFGPAATAP